MNGLAMLAFIGIGAMAGAGWTLMRHGGLLDTRQCLAVGHQRAGKDGRCPRCLVRTLMVAP